MTEHSNDRGGAAAVRLAHVFRLCLVFFVAIVFLEISAREASTPLRIYQAAGSSTFNLIRWEADHLLPRIDSLIQALAEPPTAYPGDGVLLQRYLQRPRTDTQADREETQRALERALGIIVKRERLDRSGIPLLRGIFPPILFELTTPPAVLVVAPRDRLIVAQSVLLETGISTSQSEQIESRVESLRVSALVTPIGGLATYPAMVVEPAQPADLLVSVAHEWVHARLAFEPLGWVYWSTQDGRAINETVADLIGHELGAELASELGVTPAAPPAGTGAPDPFRQEMRSIRLEVEHLLQGGRIDDAEKYMDEQRQLLANRGYRIRRLNQAYFAFYGSYAESAAGDDRVGRLVRALRAQSTSLADFLERVSAVQSLDMLSRLVQDS